MDTCQLVLNNYDVISIFRIFLCEMIDHKHGYLHGEFRLRKWRNGDFREGGLNEPPPQSSCSSKSPVWIGLMFTSHSVFRGHWNWTTMHYTLQYNCICIFFILKATPLIALPLKTHIWRQYFSNQNNGWKNNQKVISEPLFGMRGLESRGRGGNSYRGSGIYVSLRIQS